MVVVRCERCGMVVRKGKRWCKECAVEVARNWDLDYFEREDDGQAPVEDPVAVYEKENRIKTAIALAIIAVIGVMALWAVVIQ